MCAYGCVCVCVYARVQGTKEIGTPQAARLNSLFCQIDSRSFSRVRTIISLANALACVWFHVVASSHRARFYRAERADCFFQVAEAVCRFDFHLRYRRRNRISERLRASTAARLLNPRGAGKRCIVSWLR